MTTIYINHPMFDEMLSHTNPPKVPKRLQAIIDKGFCIVDGCIFLKVLHPRGGNKIQRTQTPHLSTFC